MLYMPGTCNGRWYYHEFGKMCCHLLYKKLLHKYKGALAVTHLYTMMLRIWNLEFSIPDNLKIPLVGNNLLTLRMVFPALFWSSVNLQRYCLASFLHITQHHNIRVRWELKIGKIVLSVGPFRNVPVLYKSPIFQLTELLTWIRWPSKRVWGPNTIPNI